MQYSELIWGIHPVLELLRTEPQRVREVVIQKGRRGTRVQEIVRLARAHGLKIRFDPVLKLPPHAGKVSHQGVLAKIAPCALWGLDELLARIQPLSAPVLLALDSIQDPHNLGAIIRSASAAGVSGLLLPKDRAAPLSGSAAKAAAGSLAHISLCQVTNLAAALKRLREEGYWIYGAAGEATQSIYQTDFSSGPVCLVIGGEAKGLRPLIRRQCDQLVSIPMQSPLDSLNAAAAAAVILFEMIRQRRP